MEVIGDWTDTCKVWTYAEEYNWECALYHRNCPEREGLRPFQNGTAGQYNITYNWTFQPTDYYFTYAQGESCESLQGGTYVHITDHEECEYARNVIATMSDKATFFMDIL